MKGEGGLRGLQQLDRYSTCCGETTVEQIKAGNWPIQTMVSFNTSVLGGGGGSIVWGVMV